MIDPLVGPAFVAAVLGTDAVPLVHVRFNHGRFAACPSDVVKVMMFAPFDHEVISFDAYTMSEREESPASSAACTASVTSQVIQSALTDICRSTYGPTSTPISRPASADQLFVPSYVTSFAAPVQFCKTGRTASGSPVGELNSE